MKIAMLILGVAFGPTFANDDVAKTYHEVKSFLDKYDPGNDVADFPRIAVVGVESSGKSSLLAALVALPVTHTSASTGTRAPVEYELIYDPKMDEPKIQIENKDYGAKEVLTYVDKHMKDLSPNFSDKPLHIRVTSKHVNDMIIVDLPGLKPNKPKGSQNKEKEQNDQEEIKKVQAKYIRDPAFCPVAVVSCPTSVDSLQDIETVNDVATNPEIEGPVPREDWKKDAVIVVNKINDRMVHWNPSDANDFFKDSRDLRKAFKDLIFTNLKPDTNGQVFKYDGKSFDEKRKYLQELPTQEKLWFSQKKSAMIQEAQKNKLDSHWDETNEGMFGFEKVERAMTVLWTESFLKAMPILKAKMNDRKSKDEERKAQLEHNLKNANVPKLKETLQSFIQDLLMQYTGLTKQKLVQTHDGSDKSRLKSDSNKQYTMAYKPKEYGKTLKDEYNEFPCDRRDTEWISDIMPNLTVSTNSYLASLLSEPKIGKGSFSRSFMILKYLALKRDFQEMSDSYIDSIAEGQTDSKGKNFPTEEVMFQLWETQIQSLSNGVQWYLEFEEQKFFNYFHKPWDYMTGPNSVYASVNEMHEFRDKVMVELRSKMHMKFEKVYKMWVNDVDRITRNKRLDYFVKRLMMFIILPIDDIFTNATDLKVADVPEKKTDDDLYDVDASYFQPKPRPNQGIPERHLHKMRRFHEFAEYTGNLEQSISIEDFCEAGFARLKHQEWGAVNYPYIRSIASAFYASSVVSLLEFLESSLEANVFDYLIPREQTDLQKTMIQFVQGMSDEELKGYIPIDIPSMEKEKDEIQKRIQVIDKLLPSVSNLRVNS